ncbi:hypothetical protein T05_10474 [Trichinella murrelli]|uniref:Uncharacterized protein n=1 Tax=Trichinella murrelli TaxID=144512 RepID=A0A0V0TDD2_9BILA|nr:hypothetical protein T05_10474 [Trichinella murrelli]
MVNLFHATGSFHRLGDEKSDKYWIAFEFSRTVPYRVKFELEIRNDHYSATGSISLTALILASCTVRLQPIQYFHWTTLSERCRINY